jgi:hypothetical protein
MFRLLEVAVSKVWREGMSHLPVTHWARGRKNQFSIMGLSVSIRSFTGTAFVNDPVDYVATFSQVKRLMQVRVECQILTNCFIFNLTRIPQSAVLSVVFLFLVITTACNLNVLHVLAQQKTLAEYVQRLHRQILLRLISFKSKELLC